MFGKVVGGHETLDAIEAVEVGKGDRPRGDAVRIDRVEVYTDPFSGGWVARDALTGEREDAAEKKREREEKELKDNERRAWFSGPAVRDSAAAMKPVGHLISADAIAGKRKAVALPPPVQDDDEAVERMKTKKQALQKAMAQSLPKAKPAFNFSSW